MALIRRAALRQEFAGVALLSCALLVATASGLDIVLALAAGLSLYASWHLVQAFRLLRYLLTSREPRQRWTWGLWGEAFDRLRRLRKREIKRRRVQRKILKQIRKMAEAMPDALLTMGDNGEISWLNQQAMIFFGLTAGAVIGHKMVDLVDHPALRDYLAASNFKRGLEMEAPGDSTKVISIHVTRFRKGRERYLLVARDITQQYHLDRTQRDFTLNVSHELKTPLTVLRGYIETMAEKEDQDSGKRIPLLKMQDQINRMQSVILDLFTLSRLEYGTETPKRESVDVYRMLEDILMESDASVGNSQHVLKLEGEPGLNVWGDESLLRCAFSNLVSNAIRHTPDKSRVDIRWRRQNGHAALVVSDNGEGIPARHLPRLTERFYRVDAGRSRASGGTGLGLAIVRQILDMHEVKLSISSVEGRGSTFSCVFPPALIVKGPEQALVDEAS